MAPEDKILKRFAMERQVRNVVIGPKRIVFVVHHLVNVVFLTVFVFIFQRVHEKKDMYNLNEEEELTHYGQSLAEMEKFTDAVNSDDESEEKGLLSGEWC